MEEIPAQKQGFSVYFYDGFVYRRDKVHSTSRSFRCCVRGCSGRALEKLEVGKASVRDRVVGVSVVSDHTHPQEKVERYRVRRFRGAVLRRARVELTPLEIIYMEELRRFPGVDKQWSLDAMMKEVELCVQTETTELVFDILADPLINDPLYVLSRIPPDAYTFCTSSEIGLVRMSSADTRHTMEPNIERFLEQRLESFVDHSLDNHVDQNMEHSAILGAPRCEVTMNNQGGDKLHFDGYSYSKKAISANAIRWTCATPTRSDTRCKGAITTDRERPYHNPRSLVEHNHPPEDSEANIMRDIARAKRRYRRRVYPHPLQFYPWMFPLQQLQDQQGDRDDSGSLEAALNLQADSHMDGSGNVANAFPGEDTGNVRVKQEPEWVDAGTLEPNCELEGNYDDASGYESNSYHEEGMGMGGHKKDLNYSHLFANRHQHHHQHQQQLQQSPVVQDSQDPIKLHVPGKPNLTITVATPRAAPAPSSSSATSRDATAPLPLPLFNPVMNRKRTGRPRGSAYGSYNEHDDRVTSILTDNIIANHKINERGPPTPTYLPHSAVGSAVPSRLKPRCKDPEAIRAAEIVNNTHTRSGPNVTEELEKVRLKLRQDVLALEVQNLKAEREKLSAYRRNITVRQEIMKLHLLLGRGIPSDFVGSVNQRAPDPFIPIPFSDQSMNSIHHSTGKVQEKQILIPVESSSSRASPSEPTQISVRKSLQGTSKSTSSSPQSRPSSTKSGINSSAIRFNQAQEEHGVSLDGDESSQRSQQSQPPDSGGEDLQDMQQMDSVSSDLSIELIADQGGRRQWPPTQRHTEGRESYEDGTYDDDSYDDVEDTDDVTFDGSTRDMVEGNNARGDPPDSKDRPVINEDVPFKRRRMENMWEPDDTSL